MRMLALGVDHCSAPTAVREALAFEGERRRLGLDALKRGAPDAEFVLLSTCNRVEIYAAAEADPPAEEALTVFLAGSHGLPVAMLDGSLVARRDEAAVTHLFRVAAGLESLVPGEGQVLGQVRDAYKLASDCKAVGPILHYIFQRALRVGKRVREETGLDRGKCSVASVAVDVARSVFDRFEDKAVLVIGSGALGALTLQHLAVLNPGALLVSNRDPARAHAVAARWGSRVIPYNRLDDALAEADIVVSTTAAREPIVTVERYARIQQGRGNRLAVILDLAVPRDFDPRVGALEQVMLYNVDDLRAQAEENLQGRRAQIDRARLIIEGESAACLAALRHRRAAGALLRQLGDYADGVLRRELDRLFTAQPDLTDVQRTVIARTMARLSNQLLHHPRAALCAAASTEGTAVLKFPDDLRRRARPDRQPSLNRSGSW
jgi:glutamyl-tRNA reductase